MKKSDDGSLNPDYFRDESEFSAIPYVVDVLAKSNARSAANANRVSELTFGVDPAEKAQYERDMQIINGKLEEIVKANYVGFNNSVSGFSSIFQDFTEAQGKVRKLKTYVEKSKETLINRKRNLKDLWFQKIQHERMLEILGQMDQVKKAKNKIEALLEEQQFVACVEHFQETYVIACGSELGAIDALREVREELIHCREQIHTVLIKELVHNLCNAHHMEENIEHEHFSKKTVKSLDAIVVALNRLGRLPAALHIVKSNLREELGKVIDFHLEKASSFKKPMGGLPISQAEIDDLRLENMFRDVLHDFKGLFMRHIQFYLILRSEAAEIARNDYSIQETWSTIQVEIQQLLELHLNPRANGEQQNEKKHKRSTSNTAASLSMRKENHHFINGGNFKFARARVETLDRTRTVAKQYTSWDRRKPICPPSPYRILNLLEPIVEFSRCGDELTETIKARQLMGYVREFCVNVFLPRLLDDCLNELDWSKKSDTAFEMVKSKSIIIGNGTNTAAATTTNVNGVSASVPHLMKEAPGQEEPSGGKLSMHRNEEKEFACHTNLGTTLCLELVKLSKCVEPLSHADCKLNELVVELLNEFVTHCEKEVFAMTKDKLCKGWVDRMKPLAKEDPNYLALVSSTFSYDREEMRNACSEFTKNERKTEMELEKRLEVGGNRNNNSNKNNGAHRQDAFMLLSPGAMARVAAICSTSDLLFRSLALRKEEVDSLSANNRMSPAFIQYMGKLQPILSTSQARSVLAKLDQLGETCLFSLRYELRIRSLLSLRMMASEMANGFTNAECCGVLSQTLVRCSRVIDVGLSPEHSSYVLRSLCVFLGERIIRSLVDLKNLVSPKRTMLLTPNHQQYLNQAVLRLQQTMWTILLSSHDKDQRNLTPWSMVHDQLAAFDGTNKYLLGFQIQDMEETIRGYQVCSESLLGTLDPTQLENIRNMFE